MPINLKLLKAVEECGIFPRNIIYLDDPKSLYANNKERHAHQDMRLIDIDKNLSCYMSPNLRNDILLFRSHNNTFNRSEDYSYGSYTDVKQNFNVSSFGRNFARTYTKYKNYTQKKFAVNDVESLNNWPGERGWQNYLLRKQLYEPLTDFSEYSYSLGLGLDKTIDIFDILELTYKRVERCYFKPLESIGLLNSFVSEVYRSFLYKSKAFTSFSNVKQRILSLIDTFYGISNSIYDPFGLEFALFSFIEKKNAKKEFEGPTNNKSLKGFPYLYHLAFALETLIYLSDHSHNSIFDNMYSIIKSLGYSLGAYKNWLPYYLPDQKSCITKTHIWNVNPNKSQVLINECRLQYILDLDVIFNETIRCEKNHYNKEHVDIEQKPFLNSYASDSSDKYDTVPGFSSQKKIKVLKSILESDLKSILHLDEMKRKTILYFPKLVQFLTNEEIIYDANLFTNKFCYVRDLDNDDCDHSNGLDSLIYGDYWKDWYFDSNEDFGVLKYFFTKPLTSFLQEGDAIGRGNNFEKKGYIKGHHDIKVIAAIQKKINILNERKTVSFVNFEETLLLDYLIWIRKEYFKRYSIGIFGMPNKAEIPQSNSPNFPVWVPSFSEVLKRYDLKSTDKNGLNDERKQTFSTYEKWPFRSNWKSLPRFIGLYKCTLWKEMSGLFVPKYKIRAYERNVSSPSTLVERESVSLSEKQSNDSTDAKNDYFQSHLQLEWSWKSGLPMLLKNKFIPLKCDQYYQRFRTRELLIQKEFGFKSFEFIEPTSNTASRQEDNDTLYSNDGSLRNDGRWKDGRNKYDRHIDAFTRLTQLRDFLSYSSVASKISLLSLNEFGPFMILYPILDGIKGSMRLPQITGSYPIEEDASAVEDEAGYFEEPTVSVFGVNKDILNEIDKEKVCIVSLVDGNINYGKDGLTASFYGKTYFFCSFECLMRFRRCPELFVNILKPQEYVCNLNMFYMDLPGGLGRSICSLFNYILGIQACYMDDFLVQRFCLPDNNIKDLKSIAVKNTLVTTSVRGEYRNLKKYEDFLWHYLIHKSAVPKLENIIQNVWKRESNCCFYNFPHHLINLQEVLKNHFIPDIIIKNGIGSLKTVMEFKNYDVLKNYIYYLFYDTDTVLKNSIDQISLWKDMWYLRFYKTLKLLAYKNKSGIISKLQFNVLQNELKLNISDTNGQAQLQFELEKWSNSSVNLNFNEFSIIKSASDIHNYSMKASFKELEASSQKDYALKLIKNMDFSFSNDFLNNITVFIEPKVYASLAPFFAQNYQLNYLDPRQILMKKFNEIKTYESNNHSNLEEEGSLLENISKIKQIIDASWSQSLALRENIKTDIMLKKKIKDDEEKFKSEILSIDSIAFEDQDYQKVSNKDLLNENILILLAISLKHSNYLNPLPTPLLDKTFEDFNFEDMNDFLKKQLTVFSVNASRLEKFYEGISCLDFDVTEDDFKQLLEKMNDIRKIPQFSECVVPIEREAVQKLLESGYYFLSKFGYRCPVQSLKSCLYPHKTILYDASNCYPVVHNRYIYFPGSKKALEAFVNNPLEYINKAEYNPIVPIKIVFFGPNTRRTKKVIKSLCAEYSLHHVSVSKAIEYFLKIVPYTRLGQRLKWQIAFINGLSYPTRLPTSLIWQAIESVIVSPRMATHGYIITGLQPELSLFRQWKQKNFKPHIIFYMTVLDRDLFSAHQSHKQRQNMFYVGRNQENCEFIINYDLESSHPFIANETFVWERSSNKAYIKYLKSYYVNIHVIMYETSLLMTYYSTSHLILNIYQNLKVFYSTSLKGNPEPVPIGKFLSKDNYLDIMNYNWVGSCPVCISTSRRFKQDKLHWSQKNIFFYKSKAYWICQRHANSFLTNPDEFTGNFNFVLPSCKKELSTNLSQTVEMNYDGLCPVCYWIRKPYEEYRYRSGTSKLFCRFNNKVYILCSSFCYKQFSSAPWFYCFTQKFVDNRIKYCIQPLNNFPFDSSSWAVAAMKDVKNLQILTRKTKSTFFYRLSRLALQFQISYPGWTNQESRIFFVYLLAKCYFTKCKEAKYWIYVFNDFLYQCEICKKTEDKLKVNKGNNLIDLIEFAPIIS